MQEDIKVSRQIVRDFRSEFGRPHSDTFVDLRMLQHEGEPQFSRILKKLESVRDKYVLYVDNLRADFDKWKESQTFTGSKDFFRYIGKLKKLMLKQNAGNCGEFAAVVQYEHLKKGIKTRNVCLEIVDKKTGDIVNDHVFSLCGLSKRVNIGNPDTWGKNAVLIDAWCGSGIVEKAKGIPSQLKKDGLTQLLEFFKFDPETQKIKLSTEDKQLAKLFIQNMKK